MRKNPFKILEQSKIFNNPVKQNKRVKQGSILATLLPLAACGGGSGGAAPTDPTAPPPPLPDFVENPANVFTARDNTNSSLEQSSATAGLTVTGKDGSDTINTGSGDDMIDAGDGNDIINSGAGNDVVQGGLGADYIDGGAGADILDGGSIDAVGILDRLIYKSSNAGVNVNLTTGVVSGGYAEGDTISNFESVVGSDFDDVLIGLDNYNGGGGIYGEGGDDIIIGGNGTGYFLNGGDGNDTITGGDINDIIEGGAGADILDGGVLSIKDEVTYSNSPEGVYINLATNVVSGGHAEGDTIINFEDVVGSDFDDVLIANPSGSLLIGKSGNDTLIGGTGNDLLIGFLGIDTLTGGDGDDYLSIYVDDNVTEDTVDGGSGIDILEVGSALSLENDFVLDVSRLNAVNIEVLTMTANSINSAGELNITMQDVLNLTDAGNEIRIDDDELITIEVKSTGQSWVQGADQVIDTETYHSYSVGGATLLIDADLTQDIS